METTQRELTNDELDAIQLDTDIAYSICKKYVREFTGSFNVKVLSKAFSMWLKDTSPFVEKEYDESFDSTSEKKPTATMIKKALGSAFGEVLNRDLKSEWVHITDQYGKEICVQHKAANYTTFPYSAIEKRIASKEIGFMEPIAEMMKQSILKSEVKS